MNLRTMGTLIFLFLVCAFPEVSQGHAFPDHSEPKVGSTVHDSPVGVRIWFDGTLMPAHGHGMDMSKEHTY
jgi:hypothetical protein